MPGLLALRGGACAGFRPRSDTVEETADEPLFFERAAEIDIGKQAVMVTIQIRGESRKCGRQGEDLRRLRTHTRRELVQAKTAEKQRVEKLLEDAYLKLSSVVSDIQVVSGRDTLRAVIAGERDPRVLAQMAHGRMRRLTTAQAKIAETSQISGTKSHLPRACLPGHLRLTRSPAAQ